MLIEWKRPSDKPHDDDNNDYDYDNDFGLKTFHFVAD